MPGTHRSAYTSLERQTGGGGELAERGGSRPEMQKNFIVDTNVLLHDPRSIYNFEDNHVIIPIYVLEEVDKFKRDLSELGRNARLVSRYLDAFRAEGSLAEGVPLPGGGNIKVVFSNKELPRSMGDTQLMDNRILAVALDVKEKEPQVPAVFITKDTSLRVRADALGLIAQDYDAQRVEISELYTGFTELFVPSELVDQMYRPNAEVSVEAQQALAPNEFVLLKDQSNPSHTAMGRVSAAKGKVVPLVRANKEGVWGVRPRNMEQSFTLDLLLNDEIKLVTIVGKAGTGKTLLAIAAGLQKTTEEALYQKLLVSRPIFPLGRDIGYLPGDVEQKLNPWMQPIFDNVEFLMNLSRADKKAGRGYHELIDLGIMEIEPLTYIRGRSIPNQFIIVDEAQNLTPHEVKTIITRAGDNTKIILTGDPFQIDNPYVDATSNGLVYVVNRFKNEKIAGHITMTKGERSALAELATNLL
jgi:PhoH-like ATPase